MKIKALLVIGTLVIAPGLSHAQADDLDALHAVEQIAAASVAVKQDLARSEQPGITKAAKEALAADMRAQHALTDSLVQKHADSAPVHTAAAQEAMQERDWVRGRTYGDRAVELAQAKQDPQSLLAALKTRGTAAWFAGDYPQAAQDAKRALEIAPKDHAAMALWQFSKGRLKASAPGLAAPVDAQKTKALDDLLVEISPLDDPAVKAAGRKAADHVAALQRMAEARRLYALGDFPSALKQTEAAMSADPSLPDAYMERAIIFTALKDIARALAEVTKAIALWDARGERQALAPAHALRAGLRQRSGDATGAYEDATKAIDEDPRFARAYRARAEAGEAMGRKTEEVLADFKKAAQLDPQQAAYYEEAVTRLGEGGRSSSPASGGRGHLLIPAVLGLFALALAAWTLSRRGRPAASVAAAAGERSALDAQYDIVEQIGEGGMGMVYKGWDKTLKRPVAVKRLRAELQGNARERERFIKEAEMVASLRHPHIVEIYNIIRKDDDTYLVFEYIVGNTVHQLLNESSGRHLAPERALEILRQIAEAVDHAHSRRVIHRDLKPANVMIADGGWAKVMDFGIARQVMDSLLTTTNSVVGTPTYMAPEQAMGAVVKESDVYALTCTLYEMLTGGLPFKGPDETRDKLDGRFLRPSLLVPTLPAAIDEVVARGLAPKAEDRFHSCLELYRAARAALARHGTPLPS